MISEFMHKAFCINSEHMASERSVCSHINMCLSRSACGLQAEHLLLLLWCVYVFYITYYEEKPSNH